MKRKALVVLGMPHEDTEVMHQCLRIFGAQLFSFGNSSLSEKLIQSLGFHPLSPRLIHHGHYEKKNIAPFEEKAIAIIQKQISNTKSDIILAPIDHHMSRIIPFWNTVFEKTNIEPIYLLSVRDPLSSAMALMKRAKMPLELALMVWTTHLSQILVDCVGHKTSFMFFRDWTQHLDVAAMDFLKTGLITARIDPKIMELVKNDVFKKIGPFQFHSEEDLALSKAVSAHTARIYSKFCQLALRPEKDTQKIYSELRDGMRDALALTYQVEPVLGLLERTFIAK